MRLAQLAGDVRELAARAESATFLDDVTQPATKIINDAIDATGWRDFLSGKWLGHSLHPALTDLPIGFWTSALVVDLLGGKKAKRAATLLVASGIATAVPTAMAGAHDFTELDEKTKRVGLVHAAANTVALLLYIASLSARMNGRRGRGVYLGVLGAAAATVGGYLGGHLAFGTDDSETAPLDPHSDIDESNVSNGVKTIAG